MATRGKGGTSVAVVLKRAMRGKGGASVAVVLKMTARWKGGGGGEFDGQRN